MTIKEIYPNGTECLYCRGHIEVNLTAIILIIGSLLLVMFLDFGAWDTGFIGMTCAILLIGIGAFMHEVYPRLMPLKQYDD